MELYDVKKINPSQSIYSPVGATDNFFFVSFQIFSINISNTYDIEVHTHENTIYTS